MSFAYKVPGLCAYDNGTASSDQMFNFFVADLKLSAGHYMHIAEQNHMYYYLYHTAQRHRVPGAAADYAVVIKTD